MKQMPANPIPLVLVKVTDVLASGLKVCLVEDGRRGFIRAREFSWDRSLYANRPTFKIDDVLQAVILEEEPTGGSLHLSLRQVTDPWDEAFRNRKYMLGQVVEGEVVNVRNVGAFVQIEPGIDAIIYPRNVPLLREQTIEDVLGLGDKVSAVITTINPTNRHIELNLVKRLQELEMTADGQRDFLIHTFGAEQRPVVRQTADRKASADSPQASPVLPLRKAHTLHSILIVDHDEGWVNLLRQRIWEEYGAVIEDAPDMPEALEKIRQEDAYDLVIMNGYLEDGQSAVPGARDLRSLRPDMHILLVARPDFSDDDLEKQIVPGEFPICAKNVQDLLESLDDMRSGQWEHQAALSSEAEDQHLSQPKEQAVERRVLSEVLEEILEDLAKKIHLASCAVLELNENQRLISVVSFYPELGPNQLKLVQDGLYYSPAREVIEDGQEFSLDDAYREENPRYKNFFPSLNFVSCLGLPVKIPDYPSRYGLFVFSGKPGAFDTGKEQAFERLREVRIVTEFIGIAIQRSSNLQMMQMFQEKYALGQLVEDMVHETSHNVYTLGTEVTRLQEELAKRTAQQSPDQQQAWIEKLDYWSKRIKTSQEELRDLLEAYERQRRYEYESVDINQLVGKAASQVIQYAKRNSVKIFLNRMEPLPETVGITLHLQQVIVNLLLNAIQMTARQRDQMALIAAQLGQKSALVQSGMIVVQTRSASTSEGRVLEIRVIDSGPGIHQRDLQRIFQAGITTRGGAGLGLYISRNLIERLGGRLFLFDSVLFIGSVFVVELTCETP